MKAKVTKKNCKRVAQVAFKELQNKLSCYNGLDNNKLSYGLEKQILEEFIIIKVIPTHTRNPYITRAAIISINEYYESSKWKEYMFYGAEVYEKFDKKSRKMISFPCISVTIKIEKDEQK